MTYEESGSEVQKWCPDVKYFKITDIEKNEHIANFFLDPYSRPAEKRGDAFCSSSLISFFEFLLALLPLYC